MDLGSHTITALGNYTMFILWDGTNYNVNIRASIPYTGSGDGGGQQGETIGVLTTVLSGGTQSEIIGTLTTVLS